MFREKCARIRTSTTCRDTLTRFSHHPSGRHSVPLQVVELVDKACRSDGSIAGSWHRIRANEGRVPPTNKATVGPSLSARYRSGLADARDTVLVLMASLGRQGVLEPSAACVRRTDREGMQIARQTKERASTASGPRSLAGDERPFIVLVE